MPQGFDDLYGTATKKASSTGGSFDDLYGGVASPVSDDPSQRDIDALNRQSLEQAAAKLRAIKPTSPEHKKKLDALIARYEGETGGAFGRPITHPERGWYQRYLRGAAASPLTAAADVGSTLSGIGAAVGVPGAKALQNRIEEGKADIQEAFGVEGRAGALGSFIGGTAVTAPLYGGAVNKTAQLFMRTPAKTALGKVLQSAIADVAEGKAGIAKRILTNVGVGAPVNVAAAIGAPEAEVPQDATPEEAQAIQGQNRKNFWFNLGFPLVLDAAFGAVGLPGFDVKRQAPKAEIKAGESTKPVDVDVQAKLEKARVEREKRTAEREARNQDTKLAKAEWTLANPDKNWKALKTEEKKAVVEAYKLRSGGAVKEGGAEAVGSPVVEGQAPSAEAEVAAGESAWGDFRLRNTELKPEDIPPKRTPDGDYIFYHGTSGDAASKIQESGVIHADNLGSVGIGTDPGAVQVYGSMKGKNAGGGKIIEVVVPKEVISNAAQSNKIIREIGGGGKNAFLIDTKEIPVKSVRVFDDPASVYESANAPLIDAALASKNIRPEVQATIEKSRATRKLAVVDRAFQIAKRDLEGVKDIDEDALRSRIASAYTQAGEDEDKLVEMLGNVVEDFRRPQLEVSTNPNLDKQEELLSGNQLATVRTPDGKIYSGANHADAVAAAKAAGVKDLDSLEDGFASNKRPFVTRVEAETLDARTSGAEPTGEELHTNNMSVDPAEREAIEAPEPEASKSPPTEESIAREEEYRLLNELDDALTKVQDAGGLQTEEEWDSMVDAVQALREKKLPQDQYIKELDEIISLYTPHDKVAADAEAMAQDVEPAPTTQEVEDSWAAQQAINEDEFTARLKNLHKKYLDEITPEVEKSAADAGMSPEQFADWFSEQRGKGSGLAQLKSSLDLYNDTGVRDDQLAGYVHPLRHDQLAPTETPSALSSTETPAPPQPTPSSPAAPLQSEAEFLESITHKKPLSELSPVELDRLDNKLSNIVTDEAATPVEQEAAWRDLNKIQEVRIARAKGLEQAAPEPLPVIDSNITGAAMETSTQDISFKYTEDEFQEFLGKPLKRMDDVMLQAHIKQLQDKIATLPKARREQLQLRLDDALELRADRFLKSGFKAEIPPTLGGGIAGFVGGLFAPAEDDESRIDNAFIGMAAGLAGGHLLKRYQMRVRGVAEAARKPSELPGGEWQAVVGEHVITGYKKPKREMPFLERMRNAYFQTIRRSYVGERLAATLNATNLSTQHNFAKLLAMFGRWTAQTEDALRFGPSIVDEFGNSKHLGVEGPKAILDMVLGDIKTLGELMAARVKVELGDLVKTPFDLVAAEGFFQTVPKIYHQAADRARAFSLALADVAVNGGLLSQEARDLFTNETMYASLQRIMRWDSQASTISAEKWESNVVGAAQPIKARTGGSKKLDIKNPFESMIESIPRIYRAAELNKIKTSMLDAWEAAGKPAEAGIRRIQKNELAYTQAHDQLVASMKNEMGLKNNDARALATALDPAAMDVEKGTMRVWRNGVVESYKIHPDMARAMLSLNPDELSLLTRILGLPARGASAGITHHPFFVQKMAFFDMFQVTANSAYNFRFGIDNMRGWWNIVTRSPKYQKLLAAGLSHQALTGGNLASIKTTTEALRQQAGTPLEVAVRHLREARPLEFYKALIGPLADAARVGEALRALDHGASHIEAVYAAKMVAGNYSEIGAWKGMRALQHMTMFLGPALQVLDTAAYRAGVHPFRVSTEGRLKDMARYGIKMGVMVGLPSWYLWHKADSENDDEIRQMRTTEYGRRWWFYRLNWDVPGFGKAGEIVKIPKPILDGQIFGTSIEMALDRMKGEDPSSVAELAKGIGKDAMFNFLPSFGVIPTTLAFNTDPSTGWSVVPQGQEALATEHQGEANASWLSRLISKRVGPTADEVNWKLLQRTLSPAGLDYLFNAVGGMLGRDAVTAVSAALEFQDTGYVPAKQEWPVIRQVFAQSPSKQTHDIQEFYERAGRMETVSKTIAHMMKEEPESLLPYMERHQNEYALSKVYSSTRMQIAGLRRSMNDLREMHTDLISSKDRRDMQAEYIRQMNELAAQANELARDFIR